MMLPASMHGTAEAFGESQAMRIIASPLKTLLQHCAHVYDIAAHTSNTTAHVAIQISTQELIPHTCQYTLSYLYDTSRLHNCHNVTR